jgi:hypothetical protein
MYPAISWLHGTEASGFPFLAESGLLPKLPTIEDEAKAETELTYGLILFDGFEEDDDEEEEEDDDDDDELEDDDRVGIGRRLGEDGWGYLTFISGMGH